MCLEGCGGPSVQLACSHRQVHDTSLLLVGTKAIVADPQPKDSSLKVESWAVVSIAAHTSVELSLFAPGCVP